MRLPAVPHRPQDVAELRATVRGVVALTGCAAVVVLLAFLWPAGLGGCTSLDVVPRSAAGGGLAAGDVVVTRCGTPRVGDRVVHREDGAAWAVGRVVGGGGAAWRVQDVDGAASSGWTHPRGGQPHPHTLAVLPLQVSAPALPGLGGALVVGASGAVLLRRRRRARPERRAGWGTGERVVG